MCVCDVGRAVQRLRAILTARRSYEKPLRAIVSRLAEFAIGSCECADARLLRGPRYAVCTVAYIRCTRAVVSDMRASFCTDVTIEALQAIGAVPASATPSEFCPSERGGGARCGSAGELMGGADDLCSRCAKPVPLVPGVSLSEETFVMLPSSGAVRPHSTSDGKTDER